MKRLIGLSFVFCLFCTLISAQTSTDVVDTKPEKACCSSIEACAAKMGMTVEECKVLCKEKCKGKASCAQSVEACAAKMGMSVEECKKHCKSKLVSVDEESDQTKVASASAERTIDSESKKEVKACSNKSKKCCKK